MKKKSSVRKHAGSLGNFAAKQHEILNEAYAYFNAKLWDGRLPPAFINFVQKGKAHGYFWADRWIGPQERSAHEISLCPASLSREAELVFGTLVHEMAHLWQQCYGHPSRAGYHNEEWAVEMMRIGLVPSDTAEEGGKMTGQKVSHYIAVNGAFKLAFKRMPKKLRIAWHQIEQPEQGKRRAAANKIKYQCPECEDCVWGKPELLLSCRKCEMDMVGQ